MLHSLSVTSIVPASGRRRILPVEWQWTDDPLQGVLVDDTTMVQRTIVVREPMIGESGIGHVFAQGLAFADQWFETVEEALDAAKNSLPAPLKATIRRNDGSTDPNECAAGVIGTTTLIVERYRADQPERRHRQPPALHPNAPNPSGPFTETSAL